MHACTRGYGTAQASWLSWHEGGVHACACARADRADTTPVRLVDPVRRGLPPHYTPCKRHPGSGGFLLPLPPRSCPFLFVHLHSSSLSPFTVVGCVCVRAGSHTAAGVLAGPPCAIALARAFIQKVSKGSHLVRAHAQRQHRRSELAVRVDHQPGLLLRHALQGLLQTRACVSCVCLPCVMVGVV
jgi:hypothetical protein